MEISGADVVVLFVELSGAPAAWDRLGARFQPTFEAADALVGRLCSAAGGEVIKGEGSGWMLAFDAPDPAVAFAESVVEQLAALTLPDGHGPLSPRAGAHLGPALEITHPSTGRRDLLGPTVNKAARVTSVARPGQVLLSDELAARQSAPLRPAGARVLRGIAGLHRLWSPRGVERPDRLFGRDAERSCLEQLFAGGARLVTLHGPPGVGKSRLASAWLDQAEDLDAVWTVELGSAPDLDAALRAIARALELPLGARPVEQIGLALAERGRALLVLDDADRLAEALGAPLARWMDAAPQLGLLVTSRVATTARGERLVEVEPLSPTDAAALFLDRAGGLLPPEPLPELLIRLDHLPLAVELAAAALRASPSRSPAPPTDPGAPLRSALEVCWSQLAPEAQAALVQLSVMEGDFGLEAAEAALDPDAWAPDLVQQLVDHSLLRHDRVKGRSRMLRGIASWASTRDPAVYAEAARRHARYFARLGQPGEPEALRALGGQREADEALEDLPNVLAACSRMAEDPTLAPPLALALAGLVAIAGPVAAGQLALRAAMSLTQDPRLSAALALWLGRLLQVEGAHRDALPHLERAAALAQLRRDEPIARAALVALADTRHRLGALDASTADAELALTLSASAGDISTQAQALCELALVCRARGQRDEALNALERALTLPAGPHDRRPHLLQALVRHETGDPDGAMRVLRPLIEEVQGRDRRMEALALCNLGMVLVDLGAQDEATQVLGRAEVSAAILGDRRLGALAAMNHANALVALGRTSEAETALLRARDELTALDAEHDLAVLLINLGALQGRTGRPGAASDALRDAAARFDRLGFPRGRGGALHQLAAVLVMTGALDDAERAADEAVDLLSKTSAGVELGVALARQGQVRRLRGRPDAEAPLRQAHTLAAAAKLRATAPLRRLLDSLEPPAR